MQSRFLFSERQNRYMYSNEGNSVQELERVHSINDLGVIFDTALSFLEHMSQKINKAYSMIGIIKRNFIHVDEKTFILLYKALVHLHVEYANSVWNPYKKGDIEEIEKVQRTATTLVKGLKKFSYEERLRKLRLPTLKYRRIRGDMIEVFKVVSGKYDSSVSIQIPINEISSTRGNKYKLIKDCCRLDIRNYSFASRIVW